MTAAPSTLYCSFCGTAHEAARKVIAGPGVYICDGCVSICNDILATEVAADAADGERTKPELPRGDAMSDEEILDLLPRIAATSAQVDASLQTWVGRLRERGITWARIGGALGMARQSAWERFSGEE
jgi:hypothetical protein